MNAGLIWIFGSDMSSWSAFECVFVCPSSTNFSREQSVLSIQDFKQTSLHLESYNRRLKYVQCLVFISVISNNECQLRFDILNVFIFTSILKLNQNIM